MNPALTTIDRRLRLSGIILMIGLLIEAICLLWARPLAFILLVGIGGLLVAAGVVVYLFSLVSAAGPPSATRSNP